MKANDLADCFSIINQFPKTANIDELFKIAFSQYKFSRSLIKKMKADY